MNFPSLLRSPSTVSIVSQGDIYRLNEEESDRWTAEGCAVTIAPVEGAQELGVSVYAPDLPLAAIKLRWQQIVEPGTWFLGDHWERSYGDLEWRGLVPERVMPWYFIAYAAEDTYACGVKTGTAALASWQIDTQGITLTLDIRCGARDVILGERDLLAAVVVERASQPGESPFEAARAFTPLLCDTPLLPGAPIYGANDYYYVYCENTHEGIVRDSQIISELSPNITNRPYSVVDAGWQWGGIVNGSPWHLSNPRFPDMPGLAQEIRASGCRPGIWFRPLLTTESLPEAWLLPNDRFSIYREPGWMLDPSVPEALERIKTDVRTLIDWGYELIKHDYSTFDLFGRWSFQMGSEITDAGWSFADRSRTTAEIVRGLYAAIHEAAGSAILIGCNTIGHLAAGHVHLQRIGDDTSGKEWSRTRKMGVNTLAFRIVQHDALFAIDADCVGVTEHIPWTLNRQWLDVLARSGTPLFVSIDSTSLNEARRKDLRQALERAAIPAPIGEPLDWLSTTVPAHWRFGDETVTYNWFAE